MREWTRPEAEAYRSRVRGCLLGGAVGDALGAPVEFMALTDIQERCGEAGVREYLAADWGGGDHHGLVTDDTQMTLFTAAGLIRAGVRTDRGLGFTVGVLHRAYDDWLDTQNLPSPIGEPDSWLMTQEWLYARRAPGNTNLGALAEARAGGPRIRQYGRQAGNRSKGCGAVMRSAPFGLLPGIETPGLFDLACQAAGYTHGHPTGRLSAGSLAAIVSRLVAGDDLPAAVHAALERLAVQEDHQETTDALQAALWAAEQRPATPQTVEALGAGWVAEEALAIGTYAALARSRPAEFLDALSLAVTHSGDSDSTGSICGNILGALHGETALPPQLTFEVEGRGTILQLADDFVWEFTTPGFLHGEDGPDTRWTARYPG